jgi:hypothetical protein
VSTSTCTQVMPRIRRPRSSGWWPWVPSAWTGTSTPPPTLWSWRTPRETASASSTPATPEGIPSHDQDGRHGPERQSVRRHSYPPEETGGWPGVVRADRGRVLGVADWGTAVCGPATRTRTSCGNLHCGRQHRWRQSWAVSHWTAPTPAPRRLLGEFTTGTSWLPLADDLDPARPRRRGGRRHAGVGTR